MTREEATKLAIIEYPVSNKASINFEMLQQHKRNAYIEGLLAGFEKGVRESAEVVGVVVYHDDISTKASEFTSKNYDVFPDKESILQLLNK